MKVSLSIEVPHIWEHNVEGYVQFLSMKLRQQGTAPAEWREGPPMSEHMRPEGLAQGYYCFRCGQSCNMYATGHGECEPNPEIVEILKGLNR